MSAEALGVMKFCLEHADDIFVRERVNGVWGSYALADLPATAALGHVIRWAREGLLPHRVVSS